MWKAGNYLFTMDHPPLARLIAAAPLLAMPLNLPTQSPAWKEYRIDEFGTDFLYHNRVSAERILLAGRTPMMAIALVFGLWMALWVRRKFGATVALASLAFYTLDPNIIAHSRYVATDMPLVPFVFTTVAAAIEYLETRRLRYLLWTSLLLPLAIVTKFSAVLLVPVLAVLYAIAWWQHPSEFPLRRLALSATLIAAVSLAVIAIVYWPETLRCLRGNAQSFADWGDQRTLIGHALRFLGVWIHLPTHAFPFGLMMLADHNLHGHPAYLLGRVSQFGWPSYFPVAFAVKSTLACLVGLLTATLFLKPAVPRKLPLIWYGLLIPPILLFAAGIPANINIGLRHILPIYPFLYVLIAAVLVRARRTTLLCAILVLQAAECAAIFPHYLAFFNVLSGGPANGPHYLVDSNIDWGQDVKKLAHWLRDHGTNRVYFSYFGRDQFDHEGLDVLGVPGTSDLAGRASVDGYVAASVTYLMGAYLGPQPLAWLREQQPVAKIGYSIYVYDLRKSH